MPARLSSCEHCQCEPGARRAGPSGEHIPVRRLERIERRKATTREEPDCPSHPATDPLLEQTARAEQAPRPRRLVAEQLEQLGAWTVRHGYAERAPGRQWQGCAAEREVAPHVRQEV